MPEQTAAEPDQQRADAEQQRRIQRRRKDHRGERGQPDDRADRPPRGTDRRRVPARVRPARNPAARRPRAGPSERSWRPPEVQDLSAIGLEQDVLHAERRRCQGRRRRGQRMACLPCAKRAHDARTSGRARFGAVRDGSRASCFHSAMMFRTIVASAVPWMTWIRRISLKCAAARRRPPRSRPCPAAASRRAAPPRAGAIPSGARSVASARPTVCVVCMPAPTSRNASPAPSWPMRSGRRVSPDSTISANGMIARPPNCSSVPIQM